MSICTNFGIRREWRLNGLLHREDGPAVEWESGAKHWYVHGQQHRLDGPAIVHRDGSKEWWLHGKLHKEDGPAVEVAGLYVEWFLHGKRHREDGPAFTLADALEDWWVNDVRLVENALHQHQKSFLSRIVIAGLLLLDLPPYEMLFILQFAYPLIKSLDERQVVRFLQRARISALALQK